MSNVPIALLSDAELDERIKVLDARARLAQSELARARRVRKARRKAAAKLLEVQHAQIETP